MSILELGRHLGEDIIYNLNKLMTIRNIFYTTTSEIAIVENGQFTLL
ncbi:hypothetical protein SAMN04488072_10284 [Lentibacillus halodurans]|uniref:Uncharacterized protein n=1 Tax=Lentibacillus halodurans TaxID=237679 RepID=A0A1I0VZK6_9BACI|nr:hypothetical protein SAMN04488072_10284 [Lentibacillus halodurans]